jgi:hypothetical protein
VIFLPAALWGLVGFWVLAGFLWRWPFHDLLSVWFACGALAMFLRPWPFLVLLSVY